jgi:hypothetical protein
MVKQGVKGHFGEVRSGVTEVEMQPQIESILRRKWIDDKARQRRPQAEWNYMNRV